MSKRSYSALILICIICLFIAVSFSGVSAQTSVEVLIYTGKISVTSQNDVSTTYAMPQEVKQLPNNTIIQCIDGVAIFKIGQVQVVLEAGDKLQLSSVGDTGKVSMICISGEIEAMWGEDFFKLDREEILGLTNEGTPIIDQAEVIDAPESGARSKPSSPAIVPPDPEEDLYTSTHL